MTPLRATAAVIAALALTATGAEAQRGQPTPVVAITGVSLIDGTGAAAVPNQTIVIDAGRIAAVGATGTVQVPNGARTIDGAGKFVVPGLVDAHVHWRGWGVELFLNHGVTSVLDLGNPTDWMLAVREAERGDDIRSPRVFTSAGAVGRRGGDHARVPGAPYVLEADGVAAARAAARAILVKGADVLAIAGDLSPDELRAVTSDAHAVDVPVVVEGGDVEAALNAGVDAAVDLWGVSVTLMSDENRQRFREGKIASPFAWMDTGKMDALIASMVQRRTYLIPALVAGHGAVAPQARQFESAAYDLLMRPDLRYVPTTTVLSSLTFWRTPRSASTAIGAYPFLDATLPAGVDEFRRGYRNAQEFVRRFAQAGGKVLAGTDAGGTGTLPGLSLHQELELLVDAGLTPMQALLSATSTPLQLLKKDYRIGTLVVGKQADMVVLDADPLADIKNLRRVSTVVKNGTVLDTRYHRDYSSEFGELEDVGVSAATRPVPVVTDVISRTLNQNSQVIHLATPFELVVRGERFHSSSLVQLNGQPLETSFVSASELRAKVPTGRLPVAGTYSVTVFTPWPGGGQSNVKALPVK